MLRLPERRQACERTQLDRKPPGAAPLPDSRGSCLSKAQVVQVTFFSVSQEWKKHLRRESQDVKGLGGKWLRLCTFSFSLRPCKQRSQIVCHDPVAWESVCPGCRPSVQSAVSQWLSRGLSHCPESLILCCPAHLLLYISFL